MASGNKNVIKKWGFDVLGYDVDEDNKVTKIWCKTCREYAELVGNARNLGKKGMAKLASETFIKGTSVLKKKTLVTISKNQILMQMPLYVSRKSRKRFHMWYLTVLNKLLQHNNHHHLDNPH